MFVCNVTKDIVNSWSDCGYIGVLYFAHISW